MLADASSDLGIGPVAAEAGLLVCAPATAMLSNTTVSHSNADWQSGRLGIFTSDPIPTGAVVERSYTRLVPAWHAHEDFLWSCGAFCAGDSLKETDVPHGTASEVLLPFGWGMLYAESSRVGLAPNLTWHVEEVEGSAYTVGNPSKGRPCWIVLTAQTDIAAGEELVVTRGWSASPDVGNSDIVSYSLELLESFELQRKPIVDENDTAVLSWTARLFHPASKGLRVGWSEKHGFGVFACRPFTRGEVVEVAAVVVAGDGEVPSYCGSLAEFSHALDDYVFESGLQGKGLSCLPLGFGAIYNHSEAYANVEQRWAYAEGAQDDFTDQLSPLGFAYAFIAQRDIVVGEEMLHDYGRGYWEARGLPVPS